MDLTQKIRVVIADDHALFREGVVMLLAGHDDIEVVGEAADGFQALSMAEALQPDILLLDIRMPEAGGLEVLPKIRSASPGTRVLILSGFLEEDLLIEALQQGARGYLLKTTTQEGLLKAIRSTYAGELWAERKLVTLVLENLIQRLSKLNVPLARAREALTDREQEIVVGVVQGKTNKEIASGLGISDKTVKTHLTNIFSKLKVSRRLQLLLHRTTDRSTD